jgi:DNA (cytosine-5)-methyltransferase 1
LNEPTHIDLFSGIGGFALAAKWAGFRTIAFCEIDGYCQKVLAKNFLADTDRYGAKERHNGDAESRDDSTVQGRKNCQNQKNPSGDSDDCRIFGDIFDFDGTLYRGANLLTGGFPCQPFSVAGQRRGAADDRSLWPEMLRVITQARPAFCLAENVPGIIAMELDNVLSDLESIGYATLPLVIPACAVDARHRRDRLWLIGRNMGHAQREGLEGHSGPDNGVDQPGWKPASAAGSAPATDSQSISDPERDLFRPGLRENGQAGLRGRRPGDGGGAFTTWLPEPNVGRVAHGIPDRIHRLKGLGNAIVPQVAYEILREIRKLI